VADASIALQTICRKNALPLNDDQLGVLARYVEGLLQWNKKINLISRRDEENVWFSHILHSIAPLFYVEIPQGWRILDLGSGGGLPGIPLAIVRPDISVTLLDSIRKKSMVTDEIVRTLQLKNVVVRTGRAEESAGKKEVGMFDTVVARAVASLEDLARWSRPLVRQGKQPASAGGKSNAPHLLALKGGDLEREIAAACRESDIAITVIQMSFEGSLELGLEDKKLVLVNFSHS
jgi:16S rRNA (guanine527-N7)-methyltransferase